MSSTYKYKNILTNNVFYLNAGLMVDGLRDPEPFRGHCAHTNEGVTGQNWIQVDIGGEYNIDYIALFSRDYKKRHVMLRLSNFIIGLMLSSATVEPPIRGQYPLCATYPGDVPAASRVILKCNANLPAFRYIIAQQAAGASDGYFSVCELEAYEALLATGDQPWKYLVDDKLKNKLKKLKILEKVWTSKNNQQLLNYIFMEFEADRPSLCLGQCMKVGAYNCDSFNFNYLQRICQLNQHRNGFLIGNLVAKLGWSFWNATYAHLGSF
ncbi:hypothetical protein HELRODRAFT_177589 [Helobdella robusta]|uniref:Apple domain-containing protein n=1 Tax=Helobdella robusta TaxID=6412 RepID=T1FBW8_HELRO|nr:hypothetical protein HELRODRAFT_177589 [Helobdella robusta]ESN97927.1 hypothetical protein HELRODRAFT_177589 [Helobdella robusta]